VKIGSSHGLYCGSKKTKKSWAIVGHLRHRKAGTPNQLAREAALRSVRIVEVSATQAVEKGHRRQSKESATLPGLSGRFVVRRRSMGGEQTRIVWAWQGGGH